jgi:NAD+ kinase
MRLGVLANCGKPHSAAALKRLAGKAQQSGIELVTCDQTADLLPGATAVSTDQLGHRIDAMMALGGDGTLLHAVRILNGADAPVVGVNLGSLGFMTSVTEEDLERAVDALVSKQYTTSTRTLLDCRVLREEKEVAGYVALNDVVVGWGSSTRVLNLALQIDEDEVAQYVCDGLIVSTPTGSTGHSLSAGGPIVHPHSPVLVVNVICPHTLSARPLVVGDRSTIRVDVINLQQNKKPLLSADGQGEFVLAIGDRLSIRKHPHAARFVHLPEYSYFSVLRQKLHWRGSSSGA